VRERHVNTHWRRRLTRITETKKATVCESRSNGVTGNGTPNQKQRGSAYLEIVKEEGEFVPRAVQARDRSADGIWLHEA
jgi:hypothetical protein